MTERIDPELVEDKDDAPVADVAPVTLPEYDPEEFELPEDYEYEEEGDEDGSDQ